MMAVGALEVRALAGADAVGQRHPGVTAVGGRAGHLTEGSVVGDGQGAVAQDGVQGLVLSVLVLGEVHQIGGNVIGVVVVVAVLGSVQAVGADLLVALEVGLQSLVQLLQSVLLLVKDQLLDGGHGVGVGGKTGPYHTGAEVVHGAAGGYVLALLHAALVHDGHEGLRSQLAVYALGNDGGHAGPLGDVLDLFLDGGLELLVGLEAAQIAHIGADLLAVPQGHAVVEHQLDADGPLGVGSGGPLVQAAGLLGLHAAHQAVVTGILDGKRPWPASS